MSDLHTAAQAALEWIDDIYPPDIFLTDRDDPDAVDDEGVIQIVAIRENLRAALAQATAQDDGWISMDDELPPRWDVVEVRGRAAHQISDGEWHVSVFEWRPLRPQPAGEGEARDATS